MLLPGRDTFDPQYRFGFNGKENELDFRGVGQVTDYGARVYNARLGKFLSVDPLQKSYAMLSTYQYAGNSPISGVDLDGLEFRYYSLKNEPGSDFNSHLGIDKNIKTADRTVKAAVAINWLSRPDLIMPGTKFTNPTFTITDQWNFSFNLKMSDVKVSPVVVTPDGKTWRVVPDNFDLDDLPPINDPIWSTLETPDQFLASRLSEGSQAANNAASYSQAINLVTSVFSKKNLKGEYRDAGGHHVHSKAAFKSNFNYDKNSGFSISETFMKEKKWDHQLMTNKQRELFKELSASGRPNTLAEQSKIAVKALQAGGATLKEARSLVAESLNNLRNQGVTVPTNIPWYK